MPLIPPDSPLLKVPANVDRRTVLFLDGIRYSLHVFDLTAARLTSALQLLSDDDQPTEELATRIALAISDAWLLVDVVHRLRELLQQLPRLKKKEPTLQVFLRQTASIEPLRHFVQHFRTGIDTYAATGMPVWGTLAWVRDNPSTGEPENFSIAPGTFFHGAFVPTCTFDTVANKYVERVVLQAGKLSVDLASLYEAVYTFAPWYTQWFASAFPGREHYGADFRAKFIVRRVPRNQHSEREPPSGAA
jgi:hypothetical protein